MELDWTPVEINHENMVMNSELHDSRLASISYSIDGSILLSFLTEDGGLVVILRIDPVAHAIVWSAGVVKPWICSVCYLLPKSTSFYASLSEQERVALIKSLDDLRYDPDWFFVLTTSFGDSLVLVGKGEGKSCISLQKRKRFSDTVNSLV